ncbi:hypothetical protein CJ030_MR5G021920 [Morella rubra]|uniref:Uncharacterized protein n=1 Tax=Morella rubra TaxID=262757 RepID=A0A6A1VQ62_9ROSI|nr:hypothetical protein CJ030_MR5G021920 [Morella rubra]
MMVSQNMVAEAEVICQPSLPMLDVKYHLCVATTQEHNLPIDMAPSPSSSGISADISRFESEPDVQNEVHDDKRASLLMMKFSVNEVEFAIDKLGEDAPINEIVDFITATQIAQELDEDMDDKTHDDEVRNKVVNDSFAKWLSLR